ncbi:family 20 glycosylhydrolase [Gracilibacillus salitolerans]|uniref:Family 20 glycosylhydrolase n=1 Tax=Gracilibacillus salitolerans TaxID=2663022 RepID=A0A5Q2TFT3_9BACI|nr:beta-N-acetylhexosaminidase [Gracilibacillus salitolerans]QGH33664.1 family 20 glycosylhydrolase [Gracilibacillus salitolerans]
MKLLLNGDLEKIDKGIRLLQEELHFDLTDDGFPIDVVQSSGNLKVSCDGERGFIQFEEKIHFFRALGLWLENYHKQKIFNITEEPQFDMNGIMVDASRNGVLKVGSIQFLLRKMAVMGLNVVMMYTEDTFEVEEYPYFGYMRGRYSFSELKACDDYAHAFGIEMMPCIQSLAHLKEALKWNYASNIRDTEDILLVGEEETYHFIEKTIQSATKPYRSNRIHIGMDEAHQLGLGRYLEKNGYKDRFSIMSEHLKKVYEITERNQLKPMIWSDMFFRLGSKTGNYYDEKAEIPQKVIDQIPKDLQLVYWDYYHTDKDFYKNFLNMHKELGSDPIFAGGIWTWNGIAPNYGKTIKTTHAALQACKDTGVKEVFATMWGDNGAETDPFTGLAGMQLFAEHGYSKDFDEQKWKERFSFCGQAELSDYLELNKFDETPGVSSNNIKESHPAKFLLWQDVLLGLFDKNIEGLPMSGHYQQLAICMQEAKERNSDYPLMFGYYYQLANVLSEKAEIGLELKTAYDAKDQDSLTHLRDQLKSLVKKIDDLRKAHRSLWMDRYKPFGWEVLDIRYGGVISRMHTAIDRINDWLTNKISVIEELEPERLWHDAPWVMPEGAIGRNVYHRIVTASAFSE